MEFYQSINFPGRLNNGSNTQTHKLNYQTGRGYEQSIRNTNSQQIYEKCLMSLIAQKKMHHKTMRFHMSSINSANILKFGNVQCSQDYGAIGTLLYHFGSVNRFNSSGGQFSNVCQHFECLFSLTQQFYPQEFALGIDWQNYAKIMGKIMFTATQLVITKTCRALRHPSAGNQLNTAM